MIGVTAVSTCSNPHISAIRIQDAYWSAEEARWFDETFLVEGLWIRTMPRASISFVCQCM